MIRRNLTPTHLLRKSGTPSRQGDPAGPNGRVRGRFDAGITRSKGESKINFVNVLTANEARPGVQSSLLHTEFEPRTVLLLE
jgi:hypothetical protein